MKNEISLREPTPSERKEFDFYFQLDQDTLFMFIGRSADGGRGILFSPEAAKECGESWWSNIQKDLHDRICIDWEYCKKSNDKRLQEKYTLAVTVADIISSLLIGIPPFAVVSLIMKMGLDKFCDCRK